MYGFDVFNRACHRNGVFNSIFIGIFELWIAVSKSKCFPYKGSPKVRDWNAFFFPIIIRVWISPCHYENHICINNILYRMNSQYRYYYFNKRSFTNISVFRRVSLNLFPCEWEPAQHGNWFETLYQFLHNFVNRHYNIKTTSMQ